MVFKQLKIRIKEIKMFQDLPLILVRNMLQSLSYDLMPYYKNDML